MVHQVCSHDEEGDACQQVGALYYNRNGALCGFNGCALPVCAPSLNERSTGALRCSWAPVRHYINPARWYSDHARQWFKQIAAGVCSGAAPPHHRVRTPANVITRVRAEHRILFGPQQPLPLAPLCRGLAP